MEKQVLESSEERTFQYQDSLPSLPVPPLDESLSKYLDSVKPFLNQEEYQRTEDIVKKFENGIGKELHQKLLERAKTRRNWREGGCTEIWDCCSGHEPTTNAFLHLQNSWSYQRLNRQLF
ncbi:peroxisomal carnitine O-octanoyltransferase isoform 4-T4 [Morus bassanus]